VYSDDWDPWKRYWREQERRQWDPWYRYEYERDRMSWDPYFRYLKEVERRNWDPGYRWQKYEERRMSGDWYNLYMENPADPILRQRYEMLYGVNQSRNQGIVEHSFTHGCGVQPLSVSSPLPASDEQTQSVPQSPSSSGSSYLPYFGSSEDLPSLAAVLAESIIPVSVVWFFTLAMHFGWGSASPFALALLFMFVSFVLAGFTLSRSALILMFYSAVLMVLEPWAMFGDPETVQRVYFNALLKSAIILSVAGAIYVFYWWKRIKE